MQRASRAVLAGALLSVPHCPFAHDSNRLYGIHFIGETYTNAIEMTTSGVKRGRGEWIAK